MLAAASYWPSRDRLQAGAHDFGQMGGDHQHERDLRPQQLVDREALRHEQRKHHRRHEQERDQRHAADELDVGDAERADRRQPRAPAERERDGERKRGREADRRQHKRQRQTAPRFSLGTSASPKRPPPSSADAMTGTAIQATSSRGVHQARLALGEIERDEQHAGEGRPPLLPRTDRRQTQ